VYLARCAPGSDLRNRVGWRWHAGDGGHPGNESEGDSAVYSRTAGKSACDLRGGHVRGLVARLAQTPVTRALVCDPRKHALLKVGNKSDRIDSRKQAELLRSNRLRSVYHENTGLRTIKELARSHETVAKGLTRVMLRLKALLRSWAIPCARQQVYTPRHRSE